MKHFEQLTVADHLKNVTSEISHLESKKNRSSSEKVIYEGLLRFIHCYINNKEYIDNDEKIEGLLGYAHKQAKTRAKKMLAWVVGLTLLGLVAAYMLMATKVPDPVSDDWKAHISQLESQLKEQSEKISGLESDNERILRSYKTLIEQMKKTREAFQIALEKKHDPR